MFPANDPASIRCSQSPAYFPVSVGGSPALYFGADQAEWESLYLKHMSEPSLYQCQAKGSDPELRFLWDRSLSSPIAARLLIHHDGRGTLYVHTLAHPAAVPFPEPEIDGKLVPGDVWYRQTLEKQVQLTKAQVRHVLRLADELSFRSDRMDPMNATTDGSDWIFETEESGRYRIVDFRNHQPGAARELGLYLVIDMGGIQLQRTEIY